MDFPTAETMLREGARVQRVIFDVCGTLFVENTTTALLDHLAEQGGPRGGRIMMWHLLATLGRRLGALSPAAYMRVRVRGFRGIARNVLEREATRLVNERLALRPQAADLLCVAEESDRPYGYATLTLREIASAVRLRFGGTVLCASELAYDADDICLGRYENALHETDKTEALPSDWHAELDRTCFVTDDAQADHGLLQSASHTVVFPPDCGSKSGMGWTSSVPGTYYYATRYEYHFERMAHLLKFWGTYILAFAFMADGAVDLTRIALLLIAWLAIYDIKSRQNDAVAASETSGAERLKQRPLESSLSFFVPRVAFSVGAVALLVALNPAAGLYSAGLLVVLIICFSLHNLLAPRRRGISFYVLYLLKGALPLAAIPEAGVSTLYFTFCVLFAATYLPKYVLLKHETDEAAAERIKGKLILQPIVGKNLTLLLLSALDLRFLYVLVWVNVITAVEMVCRRLAAREGSRVHG